MSIGIRVKIVEQTTTKAEKKMIKPYLNPRKLSNGIVIKFDKENWRER